MQSNWPILASDRIKLPYALRHLPPSPLTRGAMSQTRPYYRAGLADLKPLGKSLKPERSPSFCMKCTKTDDGSASVWWLCRARLFQFVPICTIHHWQCKSGFTREMRRNGSLILGMGDLFQLPAGVRSP